MELKNIRMIEIELFSQCNRQCEFCPNSFIDRHSKNNVLDERAFKKLINELSSIEYSNFISFSRYNEPFMHRDILEKRIKFIRAKLPNATLVTNTNGDFDIKGIDIDQITEMDYDGNKIELISKNYRIMRLGPINNRGGALDLIAKERDFPCHEPKFFVGVDYTGDIMPCCNLRHDVLSHKQFILGNIKRDTLFNILNTQKAVNFRKQVATGNTTMLPKPCKNCLKGEGRYTKEVGGIE